MLKPITKRYDDLSTPDSFQFVFYCDRCGAIWKSGERGFEPPADEQIRPILWNREHEEAYEQANREAVAWFSRSGCGRICDDCLAAELADNQSTKYRNHS